jgi:hypothetical protein
MKSGKDLLSIARRISKEIGSYQLVLVAIDDSGRLAACSYGKTRRACAAARPLCDAIADGIISGELPSPACR